MFSLDEAIVVKYEGDGGIVARHQVVLVQFIVYAKR